MMLQSTIRHQLKRSNLTGFSRNFRYSSSSAATSEEQTQELTNSNKANDTKESANTAATDANTANATANLSSSNDTVVNNNTNAANSKESVPVPTTTFVSASEIIDSANSLNEQIIIDEITRTKTNTFTNASSSQTIKTAAINNNINHNNNNGTVASKPLTHNKKKYLMSSLPRVPSTDNIPKNKLLIDMLMSNYAPLTTPIVRNHTRSPVSLALNPNQYKNQKINSKSISILENLNNFRKTKKELKDLEKLKFKNYNPYFNNQNQGQNPNNNSNNNQFSSYSSIFTNSILNTQQHNTELFNLPMHYLDKLKPFQVLNKPGEEHYRDDLLVVKKIEIEEKNLAKKQQRMVDFEKKLSDAKLGKFNGKFEIDDIHEYFGFK